MLAINPIKIIQKTISNQCYKQNKEKRNILKDIWDNNRKYGQFMKLYPQLDNDLLI